METVKPKKKETRNNQYRLRLTKEEMRLLEGLSAELDLSKAEVLRSGLEIQERMLTYEY